MAKAKDPARVAAGKKAWAKRMRAGTANPGGKKRSSGKPKYPSLSKNLVIIGGVVYVTGLAAPQVDRLMDGIQDLADSVYEGVQVTGATIVVIAISLKILASAWRGFGNRYRAFLRGFGLRP